MKIKFSGIVMAVLTFVTLLAGCGGGGGGGGAVPTYAVGGTMSGLIGTVVLQNNGTDDLSISANDAFTFATKLSGGAAYNVTVKTQPAGQTCTASNNTGTIAGANVTNVLVVCSWTKQLGVSGKYTYAFGVAVDSSDNVYVAGYTYGGLDGNTLTGISDFFVTKYDSSGTKLYTRQLGVAGHITAAYGVAVDSSGNVYVAGFTDGDLDGNPLTGIEDFFVTKYNSSGTKLYTRHLGVAGQYTDGLGVAVDSSDNVYVAGFTDGGLDGNTLMGTTDFFVTKYNSSGTKQYTRQLGVSGQDTFAYGVAVDSIDNVYVAGYTTGGLDGNTLTGIEDFFVTQYNSSGTKLYTRQLGGASGTYTDAFGVAVDSSGKVYVAGYTDGDLDGNTLTGTEDFFLTMYDSSGMTKVRTKQLGVAGQTTVANGVAVDSSGNVYVAGFTDGGLDGNTLTGIEDFFVTKYNSSGTKQYTRQLGVAGQYTDGFGVAVDSSDNVYVAGFTDGGLDGNTLTGITDFFVTKYDSSGIKQ